QKRSVPTPRRHVRDDVEVAEERERPERGERGVELRLEDVVGERLEAAEEAEIERLRRRRGDRAHSAASFCAAFVCASSRTVTTPVEPSISIRAPSAMRDVAPGRATIVGIPKLRPVIAVCDSMLPRSTTIPFEASIKKSQPGSVSRATRIMSGSI